MSLQDMLKKTPQMPDMVSLLATLNPKYEQIGQNLRVDMASLGLFNFPPFFSQNLTTVLNKWVANGNKPGCPTYYPVTWDNFREAIKDIDFNVYDNITKFLQKPETITRYMTT